MSAATPDVGVVVVAYQSRAWFARLKAALESQTVAYRLIVVDNASTSDHRPTAEDFPPHAEIIQNETNEGFARANNEAVSRLDTPFVALLNPDAFPEPDWLEELLAAAGRWPQAAAIGSTQISGEDEARYDGLGDCYHAFGVPWRGGYGAVRGAYEPPEAETFSPCGAAALYRRAAWEAAGGFDERYFCYSEDVDLGFRLRLMGYVCIQAPRARVVHIGGASSGKRSAFAVYHGTRNRLWTFVKCMPGPLLWALAPGHIAATALFLAVSPFRGTGRATWRGVAHALKGLPAVWRDRARVQRQRTVRLGALLAAFAWSPLAVIQRAPVLRRLAPPPT